LEPAAWQIERTDAAADLQQAGSIAIQSYVSGSSTGTLSASFDEIDVQG
jgi:hypothetical protein